MPRDRGSALVTVRLADRGEEQSHVVVNLGHRADGRTGTARDGLLFDGDCRRQPLNRIDVRLFELIQKLACVGRQGFNITTLTFGINRIECERGFAGTGETGDDCEAISRYFYVNVFEVVLACASDGDAINIAMGRKRN